MSDYVTIDRDPFARTETVRRLVETQVTCAWCGQDRPSGRLFEYGVDRDDRPGRIAWDDKVFCSRGCREAYYR